MRMRLMKIIYYFVHLKSKQVLPIFSNIYKLYIIKISKWFMLFMPIVVPFYMENGLGMKEVMLLQGIYSVTMVSLEIPSGYLADVFGRRKSLIYGSILGFSGFLCYSFSFGFWGFLIAEMVLGLGQSLISGADSAILYDTLLATKREKQYIKFDGRITSIGNIAEAIAGTMGGLLAGISLRIPYIAQTVVAFIAIPAAIMLVEPVRQLSIEKTTFKDILKIVKYTLYENKGLQKNILFSALIGSATLTMAWFVQPVFQTNNVPIEGFGLLWTLLNLTVGLVAAFAYKIEARLKQRKSIIIIAIFIPILYLAISYSGLVASLIILFLFYAIRGFATPVLKDYINRLADSATRATTLSIRNFIIRLNFALIGPFLGWYTDFYSLSEALMLAGIIFFTLSMLTMILFIRSLKSIKPPISAVPKK